MIFKTFNNDIDKISAKWGVFGKSFNDIGTAIVGRISDINKGFQATDDLLGAFKDSDSIWKRLYPTKEDIKPQLIDIDSMIPKIDSNNFDFNGWINRLNEVDKKVKANKMSWQDFSNTLDDNQKWIAKWGEETQGSIRTQTDMVKANQQARQSALAHNEALKQQTLGAKAASVAMKALTTVMNMALMYAVTKLITAWDDYKESLREAAQEMSEQAEETASHARSLLDLQKELEEGTSSTEDLTSAFREQMRMMGYTEEEIDNLIDKYDGLAGAIKGATEEALNNAKTDAYADMSTSGRSLMVEAKGNTNVSTYYAQNKELSEEIRKMLEDSPAILDGGVFRMDKNASAEDIYEYYLTLKDISQLIQETASETGDESLLSGDSLNPTPYYQVSEALDALSESAELYGDAISRLHNADAQLELSNYLKTNDIDTQEAFDTYTEGIKNNTAYSEAYKQVLLEVANDAFPQFSAAAKDASDSMSDFGNGKTVSLGIKETVSQLNTQLKPAMDSLASAWEDIFSGDNGEMNLDKVDLLSVADSIKKELDTLNDPEGLNLGIDYSAYENFIRILEDTESTEKDVKQGFNALAQSIVDAGVSGVEDFETLKDVLEDLGVVNNDIIAFQSLVQNTEALKEAGLDLANATESDIEAFARERVSAEYLSQAINMLKAQKILCNENWINSSKDINDMYALAQAAGIATNAIVQLSSLKIGYDLAVKNGNSQAANAINAQMQNIKTQVELEFANLGKAEVDYSPMIDDAGKGGGDAGDKYLEEFEKALENLKNLRDRGKISEKQYLEEYRKLYERYFKDIEKYAEEFAKHQHEYLSGMKSLYESVFSAITDIIDRQIDQLEKQRDAEIDSYEDKKEAASEYYESLIEEIDEQIEKIEDATEAREDEMAAQKALYDLLRSQNQRTIKTLDEHGNTVYKADPTAIRDNQENYEDIKSDMAIKKLQKQREEYERLQEESDEYWQKMIDDTNEYYDNLINSLEEYKSRWEELMEMEEQAKMLALLEDFGYTEEDILNMSEEAFADLKTQYLQVLKDMYNGNENVLKHLSDISGVDMSKLQGHLDATADKTAELAKAFESVTEAVKKTADTIANMNGDNIDALQAKLEGLRKAMESAMDAGRSGEAGAIGEDIRETEEEIANQTKSTTQTARASATVSAKTTQSNTLKVDETIILENGVQLIPVKSIKGVNLDAFATNYSPTLSNNMIKQVSTAIIDSIANMPKPVNTTQKVDLKQNITINAPYLTNESGYNRLVNEFQGLSAKAIISAINGK